MGKWWKIAKVLWGVFKVVKTVKSQEKIDSVIDVIDGHVKKDGQ